MRWTAFWTDIGAAAGAILALVAVAQLIVKPLRKLLQQNDEFREDWYGRPARPGVAPEPGVMERLGKIEHNTNTLPDRVATLEMEQGALKVNQAKTDELLRAHIAGHTPTSQ